MTELIKYLIFSGTLIALAVIATFYQLIKKGLFRITVEVEEDPEKEGKVEIEVTNSCGIESLMKSIMPDYLRDIPKIRKHDPRLNTPEEFREEQEKRLQASRFKKGMAKRVLEDIPPDYQD